VDGRIGRRSFLGALAAGSVTLIGARLFAVSGGAPRVADRIRAPGDVVDVDWPGGLDRTRVRFVHRVDGRTVGVAPVPAPTNGPRVRLVADPAGGLLPGLHEFTLEAAGTREDLGGFRVTAFAFGC
jgi:hypothetical protein